jgi:hypothetical protein
MESILFKFKIFSTGSGKSSLYYALLGFMYPVKEKQSFIQYNVKNVSAAG